MENKLLELKPEFKVEKVEERTYRYLISGQKCHGVTSVLSMLAKPWLVPWATKQALNHVKMAIERRMLGAESLDITITPEWIDGIITEAKLIPKKITIKSADIGTRAHARIDSIIKGLEVGDMEEDIKVPVQAFRNWWADSGIELVASEVVVGSQHMSCGGTLDAIGKKDGKYILLDWKTSNQMSVEYKFQVAAYAEFLYCTYHIDVDSALIVRFGKTVPDFEVVDLNRAELDKYFDGFDYLNYVYQIINTKEEKVKKL